MATTNWARDSAPNRRVPSLIDELRSIVQPGDLLLAGGDDVISRIIKIGTTSLYCHVGVVIDEDHVVESYDQSFTPVETDDGVAGVSLAMFANRNMTHLKLVRPTDLDVDRLLFLAEEFTNRSAPYPSIGAVLLAVCGLSARVLRPLPGPLRHRVLTAQVRLAGDGATSMHCAESATRLYLASGMAIELEDQVLQMHVDHTRQLGFKTQPFFAPLRTANKGEWPKSGGRLPVRIARTSSHVMRLIGRSLRTRWRLAPDEHDFVMPADLNYSTSFAPVATYEKQSDVWIHVE